MRLIFANITQGFMYTEDPSTNEGKIMNKFSIPDYIKYLAKRKPDILCLAEVLIDDKVGNSEFVNLLSKATQLPYFKTQSYEKSWLYIGRYYGIAILSKFPISDYEKFKLPNPKLEVIRPNGDHWTLHDKYAQYAKINLKNYKLNLFNLHYFPFHIFNRSIKDKEIEPYRKKLSEYITSKGFQKPTIITGDFNNKGSKLINAFPELFISGDLKEAIEVKNTKLNGNDQSDHVLFTPETLKVKASKAEKYFSTHYSLTVDFE